MLRSQPGSRIQEYLSWFGVIPLLYKQVPKQKIKSQYID